MVYIHVGQIFTHIKCPLKVFNILKVQIKTALFTTIRMAKIIKQMSMNVGMYIEKGELLQPLWKPVCSYLGKQEIEQPYDPALSFLGIFPNSSIFFDGETFSSMLIVPLFITDEK